MFRVKPVFLTQCWSLYIKIFFKVNYCAFVDCFGRPTYVCIKDGHDLKCDDDGNSLLIYDKLP